MYTRIAKKRMLLALGISLVIFLLAVGAGIWMGSKPFGQLKEEEVVRAKLSLTPPDISFELSSGEIRELVPLLRELRTFQGDNRYTDYAGQMLIFTIGLRDGSEKKVAVYSPYIIIDDIGYRAEESPCEALSLFANRLASERAS